MKLFSDDFALMIYIYIYMYIYTYVYVYISHVITSRNSD